MTGDPLTSDWYDEPVPMPDPLTRTEAVVSIAVGLAIGALVAWAVLRWIIR